MGLHSGTYILEAHLRLHMCIARYFSYIGDNHTVKRSPSVFFIFGQRLGNVVVRELEALFRRMFRPHFIPPFPSFSVIKTEGHAGKKEEPEAQK